MPESRRLHKFCIKNCVSIDIYDDSNLSGQKSDKTTLSDIKESRMASADEEPEIVFSPSEADKSFLQQTPQYLGEQSIHKFCDRPRLGQK